MPSLMEYLFGLQDLKKKSMLFNNKGCYGLVEVTMVIYTYLYKLLDGKLEFGWGNNVEIMVMVMVWLMLWLCVGYTKEVMIWFKVTSWGYLIWILGGKLLIPLDKITNVFIIKIIIKKITNVFIQTILCLKILSIINFETLFEIYWAHLIRVNFWVTLSINTLNLRTLRSNHGETHGHLFYCTFAIRISWNCILTMH